MKFRVGDIVTGKKSADDKYSYTTSQATMQVIGVKPYEIEVQIIAHIRGKRYIGMTFWVYAKHFTLVKSGVNSNYIEIEEK